MNPFKSTYKTGITLLIAILVSLHLMGQQIDSIKVEQSSMSNTLQKRSTKRIVTDFLFAGTLIKNQQKNQSWYIPSLFELIPPNTIEGFVINPRVSFTQYLPNGTFLNLKPNLRYGFGNKRFQAQLATHWHYAPSKKASILLSGGRFVEQFNQASTLIALNNTIYTFLLKENYLKIYEREYLEITHIISPIQHFLLTTTLSWNNRNPLRNLPKYDTPDSEFTSNLPVNEERPNTDFEQHQALLWDAQLLWQFGHQNIRHKGAFKSWSPYPAIAVSYSGAFSELLGSDVSYQKLSLQVREIFNAMKWGTVQFQFEIGDFLAKDQLSFMDYHHFNGKRTVYGNFDIGNFQLLDYYQFSTANFYIELHYEHQWNGLTNKNKSSLIKPVIAVHYLYTQATGSYYEAGIGLNKLLNFWRVDFYSSWSKNKHERLGVRIGVVID